MFSYYNISLSLFFNKSFAEPYFSTTSRRFCSFKDAHVPFLTVTDAICRCGKARIILPKSLYRVLIKAFPSYKTLFYTDARHTICRYTSDCFSVSESARTQADGMLSANTRFSETSRCPHSPISSTVLRLRSVCLRHIRSISFHSFSFKPPYPVLHLSRRRMRCIRSLAEKKRRKDGSMAV